MSARSRYRPDQGRANVSDNRYDIGALEQRVYAVEKGQSALAERIDEMARGLDGRLDRISQKMDLRATPQWQAFSLIAAISIFILSSFGALSVSFIQGRINTVDIRVDETRATASAFVPRVELQAWRDEMKTNDQRLAESLLALRADSVSGAEHTEVLNRLNKVETRQDAISPPSSQIADILDRLKRLEERPFRGNWNSHDRAPTNGVVVP